MHFPYHLAVVAMPAESSSGVSEMWTHGIFRFAVIDSLSSAQSHRPFLNRRIREEKFVTCRDHAKRFRKCLDAIPDLSSAELHRPFLNRGICMAKIVACEK